MCRLLAYKGSPVTLHRLVYEADHSLEEQSYQPEEMLSGTVNVDGFGCGWHNQQVREEPGVYRTLSNLWSDMSFRSLSGIVTADLAFASVRNATPPSPTDIQSVQPLSMGPYLFMHNGHIKEFHGKVKRPLHNLIPDDIYAQMYSASDSAAIFALLYHRLRQQPPSLAHMQSQLADVLYTITDLAREHDVACYLNLALTDGTGIVFSRYSNDEESNSLYRLEDGQRYPDAVLIVSEPLDDDQDWQAVPHNSIVSIDANRRVRIEEITEGAAV
ncbi:MAG TPA: ergothioneine biosynthesis protein EgtC [bacterium]|nr:ergothioneine biosynthesis protein EgtC [bacterium]